MLTFLVLPFSDNIDAKELDSEQEERLLRFSAIEERYRDIERIISIDSLIAHGFAHKGATFDPFIEYKANTDDEGASKKKRRSAPKKKRLGDQPKAKKAHRGVNKKKKSEMGQAGSRSCAP